LHRLNCPMTLFRSRLLPLSALWAMFALVPMTFAPPAAAQADQRKLVTSATITLSSFLADPEMGWLKHNLGRAKAVMIAPEITKASFIVGGSGGRAVVVAERVFHQ